jgi:UDP-N-acetylglucosamine 2-epimerase (non-hydrolysing)
MTAPSVLVVAGTRPEWQKLSPVIAGLRAVGVPTAFLWTGQHSDPAMTSAFAEGLGWPEPDGALEWNPNETRRAADIRGWWRARYGEHSHPAMLLVQGDTASGLAGLDAVVSSPRWRSVTIVHLEAGLRSWESDLPEEVNRREIDRFADLLLCPSPLAAAHAKVDAKVGARIVVTGQTGLDALVDAIDRTPSPPPTSPPYALLTLHRAALADDAGALAKVLDGARNAARRSGLALLWPVHPRVAGRQGAMIDAVRDMDVSVIDPLPYCEMAALLGGHDRPAIVISDSGGLVEEACYLGIPTVIVRPATERWELVAQGHADLVRPADAAEALPDAVVRALKRGRQGVGSPYGDPRLTDSPSMRAVAEILRALEARP